MLDGGKYGPNTGFDLVLQGKDGTVTVILDGKQILASGAVKLSSDRAGGFTQNSMDWVNTVLKRLDPNSAAFRAVQDAIRSNSLVTAIGGVNRTTGQLVFPARDCS